MKAADRDDIDHTAVIMSIRWEYALALLDGSKRREFRRIALPSDVTRVLINPTGRPPAEHEHTPPGLLGMFDVAYQVSSIVRRWLVGDLTGRTPFEELATLSGSGIDSAPLAAYAGGYDEHLTAIEVAGTPIRFPCSIPLADLHVARSPQSWRYAPANWREVIAAEVLLAA